MRSILIALLLVTACKKSSSGGDSGFFFGGGGMRVTLIGKVTSGGVPVTDATVTAGTSSTTTGADGGYSIQARSTGNTASVRVEAPGMAPMVATVVVKGGVTKYEMPVNLVPYQEQQIDGAGGGSITIYADGQPITISVPAGAASGPIRIRAAAYDYRSGPGRLESVAEDGSIIGLQSAAMFFTEIVDTNGDPVTLQGGLQISSSPFSLPSMPETQPMSGWSLAEDGRWENPQAASEPEAGMALSSVPPSVIYNCDRGYPNACVRGVLRSASRPCPGKLVTALGPPGIASGDSVGGAGEFCFTGPLGATMNFSAGSSSGGSVTMANSYGGCAEPASCTEVTDFEIPDEECEVEEPEQTVCEFTCPGSDTCIAAATVCNGTDDCPGGSDEDPSICGDESSCCIATQGCPGETGDSCADSCCCCPGGMACCADHTQGCCPSP
jgi:hypothetical protein